MKKKKNMDNNEASTMFLLRSTYFNGKAGKNIYPEFYSISLPVSVVNSVKHDDFLEFMMRVYDENFSNESSIEKMKEDYAKYYRNIDKKLL